MASASSYRRRRARGSRPHGYKELNLRSALFVNVLAEAAADAKRDVTHYLKGAMLRVWG